MRNLATVTALFFICGTANAQQTDLTLIPKPREVQFHATQRLTSGVSIDQPVNAADRFAAGVLRDAMRERGVRVVAAPAGSVRITLLRTTSTLAQSALKSAGIVFSDSMRAEGYVVVPKAKRLYVIGATSAGVFYGVQTVAQLVNGSSMQLARIRDWPAMKYRGLHDDLSRGPVPTLEFQKQQIRTFAAYKLNVYSPYYEHTLAYRSQPLPAPAGGAMTPEQVRELVAFAKQYHVDVIPEQEAFGHLHHMLKWELYSPLAETPHGHVLAPGQPGSIALIAQLFGEIAELFPSPFIHLGADETFELGRGQTAERVRTEGIGPVYLQFLKAIADSLAPLNRRFLFWGDVAGNHPDLVATLPRSMVAVAWSYGVADSFDRLIKPFSDVGMETWVAPGVSNWNRVFPNNSVALRNIQVFVRDGQRLGSTGVLNTSWDDDGDALFNQTWYGVLFGAAAAWQPGESSIPDFERSYGRVFHGDTTGAIDAAQRELAAAHARLSAARIGDASNYAFWLDPWSSEGLIMARQVLPAAHDVRMLAESALVHIAQARHAAPLRYPDAIDALELGARRIDWLAAKFQFANDIAAMYQRASSGDTTRAGRSASGRELSDISGINGRIQDMRDGYANLKQLYQQAWLAENRPYWLENVLVRFDVATQTWVRRAQDIAAAGRARNRTGGLPPAASLGIPAPISRDSTVAD